MHPNLKEFTRESADELSDKLIIKLKDMLVDTTQVFIDENFINNDDIQAHESFSILLSAHSALFADTVRFSMAKAINNQNKKNVLKNCKDLIQTHFMSIEHDMNKKVNSNENSTERT